MAEENGIPIHRPVHLHPRYVLIVIVGGIFGALARYGLSLVLPAPGGWPLPTLLINLSGALALGALLEGLSRRGPDAGVRRTLRLLAGTGFMGAYTTYSTLALDSVKLFDAGRTGAGVLYVLASLFGGALATFLGIWLSARQHRTVATRDHAALASSGSGRSGK